MSDNEKQCLLVARVILQKPRWVVLNGAIAGLDLETRQRIEAVFDRDLADVGVLNVGRDSNEAVSSPNPASRASIRTARALSPMARTPLKTRVSRRRGPPPNRHHRPVLARRRGVRRQARDPQAFPARLAGRARRSACRSACAFRGCGDGRGTRRDAQGGVGGARRPRYPSKNKDKSCGKIRPRPNGR